LGAPAATSGSTSTSACATRISPYANLMDELDLGDIYAVLTVISPCLKLNPNTGVAERRRRRRWVGFRYGRAWKEFFFWNESIPMTGLLKINTSNQVTGFLVLY
jgi:hypothetical protein